MVFFILFFILFSIFNNVFNLFIRSISILLALCIGLLISAHSLLCFVRLHKISLNLVLYYENRCKLPFACRPYLLYKRCITVILIKVLQIRHIIISHKYGLLPNYCTTVSHEAVFMNIHFNGNILYTILVNMPHVTLQFVCIPRLVDQACRGCRCIVLGAGASRPWFGRFVPLLLGWLRRGGRVCSVGCALRADTINIPMSILLIHS